MASLNNINMRQVILCFNIVAFACRAEISRHCSWKINDFLKVFWFKAFWIYAIIPVVLFCADDLTQLSQKIWAMVVLDDSID